MGKGGDAGGDGTGNGAKLAAGEREKRAGAGAALLVSPPWPADLTPGFGRRWVRAGRGSPNGR